MTRVSLVCALLFSCSLLGMYRTVDFPTPEVTPIAINRQLDISNVPLSPTTMAAILELVITPAEPPRASFEMNMQEQELPSAWGSSIACRRALQRASDESSLDWVTTREHCTDFRDALDEDSEHYYGFLDESLYDDANPIEEQQRVHIEHILHNAYDAGLRDQVFSYIGSGYDLDELDEKGQTVLHKAALSGDKELCETLLVAGVNVDVQDEEGCTPLHGAARKGHASIVALLLTKNSARELQTVHGWTPLHSAVWHGQAEVVALLLLAKADIQARCQSGNTPLHYATWKNYEEVSKLLIFCGASLSEHNDKGATPFHYAAYRGNCKLLELMISQDIDLALETAMGNTALHCAAWRGHRDAVALLLDYKFPYGVNKKGETPLRCACIKGHAEVEEFIRSKGFIT